MTTRSRHGRNQRSTRALYTVYNNYTGNWTTFLFPGVLTVKTPGCGTRVQLVAFVIAFITTVSFYRRFSSFLCIILIHTAQHQMSLASAPPSHSAMLPKDRFREGMKLEALDRRFPYYVCEATVQETKGVMNIIYTPSLS